MYIMWSLLNINKCSKMVLLKSLSRVHYLGLAPPLSLPPEPILTGWGTWADSVLYYVEHLQLLKEVVNSLDTNDTISIHTAQNILSTSELEVNLLFK